MKKSVFLACTLSILLCGNLHAQFNLFSTCSQYYSNQGLSVDYCLGESIVDGFSGSTIRISSGFLSLSFDESTNIQDITQQSFKVFPNPFHDQLFIEPVDNNIKVKLWKLYDFRGSFIFSSVENNSDTEILNTKELKPGFYTLILYTEKQKKVHAIKLIKQ